MSQLLFRCVVKECNILVTKSIVYGDIIEEIAHLIGL
jgi:hypothetical protein